MTLSRYGTVGTLPTIFSSLSYLPRVDEVEDSGEVVKPDAGEVDERDVRLLGEHVEEESGAGGKHELHARKRGKSLTSQIRKVLTYETNGIWPQNFPS